MRRSQTESQPGSAPLKICGNGIVSSWAVESEEIRMVESSKTMGLLVFHIPWKSISYESSRSAIILVSSEVNDAGYFG